MCVNKQRTLVHRANSVVQADVYAVHENGRKIILKDYSGRPAGLRAFCLRRMLRHEDAILRALAGIAGVPRSYGFRTPDVLAIEYIVGSGPIQSEKDSETTVPPPLFFANLKVLVAAMHARGVAHGDIRRHNILRNRNDRPVLIDFATAVSRDATEWFAVQRLLFPVLRTIDRFKVLKLCQRYAPSVLDKEELETLKTVPWYMRAGRFLRKKIYSPLIKQKHWRQRLGQRP